MFIYCKYWCISLFGWFCESLTDVHQPSKLSLRSVKLSRVPACKSPHTKKTDLWSKNKSPLRAQWSSRSCEDRYTPDRPQITNPEGRLVYTEYVCVVSLVLLSLMPPIKISHPVFYFFALFVCVFLPVLVLRNISAREWNKFAHAAALSLCRVCRGGLWGVLCVWDTHTHTLMSSCPTKASCIHHAFQENEIKAVLQMENHY